MTASIGDALMVKPPGVSLCPLRPSSVIWLRSQRRERALLLFSRNLLGTERQRIPREISFSGSLRWEKIR